jgi:stage II sporulation protein D
MKLLCLSAAGLALGASSASAATTLVVSGRGWGHGVGMSQWGAYGYASHGWSWRRILAHYYPGTEVGVAPRSRVRILLARGRPRANIGCAGPIRVSDATGRGHALLPNTYGFGRGLRLPIGRERVKVNGAHGHRERSAVVPALRPLRSPLVFDCPTAPLTWNGRAYHGLLVVRRVGRRLTIVNSLPLDQYVRGVVAGEMPHRWSIAALEAQAVAARSYALATLHPGKHFDLFPDTRDQVYGGIAYETPRTNIAVDRTAGRVLMWRGRVATTYFFSTSGGRTADVSEVWPSLGKVPYLRSVDDPYDVRSPHHAWGPITYDAARVAKRLRVPPGEVKLVRSASGHVTAVQIGTRRVDAGEFRNTLNLASTWFDVGELSLARNRSQISYGGRVELTARVEGLPRAALQRRVGAGMWKTLKLVNGTAEVTVEPRAQTLYRLSSGFASGAVVGVAVAPVLEVKAAGVELLTGSVAPRSSGAISVWRRMSHGWTVVARPSLDPRGQFRTQLRLRRGDYRITVDGDGRYAAVSKRMRVTPRLLASLDH